ncbi:SDR family oxidoreductase [Isoptericola sp. b441]|uniref:SDR family oxidoreductase n=1 Tax=Actinotalea lenta TaxID=3064654 RepID=A0ABT9D8F8_9CELL|nr:SDR family oxidoreductase [Isoptericola sp. b441]MDO8107178.1 SDR family oxidoreductase [Isoptericola sp. b441]
MSTDVVSSIFAGAFTGRRVAIVGAGRGIGRAVAEAFAVSGAAVHMVDHAEMVHEAAAELAATGAEATSAVADVTVEGDVVRVFADLADRWGALDVLVNNAGVIRIDDLAHTTTEDFARVLAVNTTGQFVASREAYPLLKANGGGVILNAASGQARQGFIYTPSYAASKFGVVGLTQSLAKELAKDNIRVNAYCPGIVPTEMWEYNDREWGKRLGDYKPGELMQEWIDDIPLGRGATSSDIANALLFLASDAGSYITGQALNIDGGMFMN